MMNRNQRQEERGEAPTRQQKALGPFSQALKERKEELYDKVKLSVRQMDVIIYVVGGLLAIVLILIILEATGIFKL